MNLLPRVNYYGNSFIGLYFKANDQFILGPFSVANKLEQAFDERLSVPLYKVGVDGSDLVGLYTSMNNNGIIVSSSFQEKEVAEITRVAKKYGLNIYQSKEIHNASGNNLCANSHGGLVNPDISKGEIKNMEDTLGVELVPRDLVGYKTVGSMCLVTEKGFVCHNDLEDYDLKELESIFKVEGLNVTVNLGVSYAGSGLVANINGYLIGSESTGVEIQRVEEALDLMR